MKETKKRNGEFEEQFKTHETTLNTFTEKFKQQLAAELKQLQNIKEDLKQFSDKAVTGSLFACYQEAYKSAQKSSQWHSIGSLVFLIASAGILGYMIFKGVDGSQLLLSSSISFMFLTASFICASKSKVSHKSFEEYLHKATLLQSFVGYRKHFEGEEYDDFLKSILEAIKVNASDKVDPYLRNKMLWQKGAEIIKDGVGKTIQTTKEGIGIVKNS